MKILRPFIILLGLACFVGLTWITADIYILGLHLSNSISTALHTSIIVFWILFLFSFFSGRITSGAHIRILYLISNTLFGIMFYLFLGSLILSISFVALPSFSIWLAYGIFAISFLLGIIGIFQAKMFRTTHYEVLLEGAPESWDSKRAVFISDTHFGLIHGKRFANQIVDKILKINPDFVLHGGDFYDGPTIKLQPIIDSWKKLTDHIPMFYTSGNHEHYGDYEAFVSSVNEMGATVLLDEKVIYDGVQIAGITYRGQNENVKAGIAMAELNLHPSIPTILINHPPTFHNQALGVSVDLMVSGHTHRGQFSPISIITRMIYKKFHYGVHQIGEMVTITSRGVGTAGPPLRLFNKPEFVVIKFKTK